MRYTTIVLLGAALLFGPGLGALWAAPDAPPAGSGARKSSGPSEGDAVVDRIKLLRDRLHSFVKRDEPPAETTPKSLDPVVESENLEHRADVKMMVLFHDETQLTPVAASTPEPKAPVVQAPPATGCETARPRIEMASLTRERLAQLLAARQATRKN